MFIFLGYLIVFFSVIGAYVLMGGALGALYQPFEVLLIGGAAAGAYLASSSGQSVKMMVSAIPSVLRRNPYEKDAYMQLMALLYVLLNKARRDGLMSIEGDIEEPHSSPSLLSIPAW